MEQQRGQRNERAIALEAQQGVQFFDSYVRERTAPILAALDAAKNWQDLHKELHRHGLEIRPKGNGLIIKSRHGKQALKASDVDRRLSKSRLEKVLGEYQPPMPILAKEESRYRSRPVQRSPAGEALYARYQAEAAERKQQADAVKAPTGRDSDRHTRKMATAPGRGRKIHHAQAEPAQPDPVRPQKRSGRTGRSKGPLAARNKPRHPMNHGTISCAVMPTRAMKPPWPYCAPENSL